MLHKPENGLDGLSAYEIACAKGFRGTPDQWLATLKGPVGAEGAPGRDGLPGATGRKGDMGPRGHAGRNGFDGRAGTPGAVGKMGLAGPSGPQGATGPSGPIGPTGATGPQGNAAIPMFPTHAEFDRDPISKLTRRLLVEYPIGSLEIRPVHDGDGYMIAADFAII